MQFDFPYLRPLLAQMRIWGSDRSKLVLTCWMGQHRGIVLKMHYYHAQIYRQKFIPVWKSVPKYIPALLNWSTCIRKSHFSLLVQREVHQDYEMVEWTVNRFNTCNKPIYTYFKAPLHVILAGEGRVANRKEPLIRTLSQKRRRGATPYLIHMFL